MKPVKVSSMLLLSAALFLAGILVIVVFMPTAHLYNYLRTGFPTVQDYKNRPTHVVKTAPNPQDFEQDANFNRKQLSADSLQKLETNKTDAFLVVQNGKLKFEQYWNGYDRNTLSNSFSMAKTMVAMLVGIAINEGKIKSVEQPVSDFLPYFNEGGKEKIKLKHLLTMSSGLNFEEKDQSWFGFQGRLYYGNNLENVVKDFAVKEEPGKIFWYRSGDTAIVGLILQKVYAESLADLLSEKIFAKIGAPTAAQWSTDFSGQHEIGSCCLNATARDFARLGELLLNEGNWHGEQIFPAAYYKEMTTSAPLQWRDDPAKPFNRYGYYTHLFEHKEMQIISANGFSGQYIWVIPAKKVVIVRLGESDWTRQRQINFFPEENFWFLDAGLELLD